MQALGRAECAPDRIDTPPETTAPIAEKAGASQRDVSAGNGSTAGATADEPTVPSSETAVAGASAEETAGDKRGGKRRRGIFKLLGLEEDGAAASGR
jgi:hypothetical protein